MPKPPKKPAREPNHALQILRKHKLQMTQQEFADLLGVTKDSVRYWETNVRPLTEDRAIEIMCATGADPASLLDGKGNPKSIRGEDYTPETWEWIRKRKSPVEMEAEWSEIKKLGESDSFFSIEGFLRALFAAAALRSSAAEQICILFCMRMITEVLERLDLESEIDYMQNNQPENDPYGLRFNNLHIFRHADANRMAQRGFVDITRISQEIRRVHQDLRSS